MFCYLERIFGTSKMHLSPPPPPRWLIKAALRSKAMVLLLLICCLVCFPLVGGGGGVCVCFCFVVSGEPRGGSGGSLEPPPRPRNPGSAPEIHVSGSLLNNAM